VTPVDAFSRLQLAPAPWLDPGVLTGTFQRLAAVAHPDAGGSADDFSALNEAWRTLRDPASCLRHYLELQHPGALALNPPPPPELGDLFMDIAAARRAHTDLRAKEEAASSPIARAVLAPARAKLDATLAAIRQRVSTALDSAMEEIRSTPPPARLAEIHTRLVFLEKWSAQLRPE
jgi:hypothetical protein